MNINIKNSHAADISAGKLMDEWFWYKFGECELDTSLQSIWSGATSIQPGLYQYIDRNNFGVPETLTLYSSSAADVGQTVHITGLNKNKKPQSEIVTLNGTVGIDTLYEYLRVFRMSTIMGTVTGFLTLEGTDGTLYAHIEDSGLQINQTQMAIYTVPAGHTLQIKKVTCTKSDTQPIKVYASIRELGKYGENTPFRVQLNWNSDNTGFSDESPYPFFFSEYTDIEFRGIAISRRSSDVALNAFGHETRVNSVPVLLENLSAISTSDSITVTWDGQTPADMDDRKNIEVKWFIGTEQVGMKNIRDRTVSSCLIDNLIDNLNSSTEYRVEVTWVGYDNRRGDVQELTISTI